MPAVKPARPACTAADDTCGLVGQQQRHAVRNEYRQGQIRCGSDDPVAQRDLTRPRPLDDVDHLAVALVQEEQPRAIQPQGLGEPLAVCLDRSRLVTDMTGQVQRVEGLLADAAQAVGHGASDVPLPVMPEEHGGLDEAALLEELGDVQLLTLVEGHAARWLLDVAVEWGDEVGFTV